MVLVNKSQKFLPSLIIGIFLLTLCACPPQKPRQELALKFLRAMEHGQIRKLDQMTSEDFIFSLKYKSSNQQPVFYRKEEFLRRRKYIQSKMDFQDMKEDHDKGEFIIYVNVGRETFANSPVKRFESIPFKYMFGFKNRETIQSVVVDTTRLPFILQYPKWNNYEHFIDQQSPHETLNKDSLKAVYKKVAEQQYLYMVGAEEWQ